MACFLVPAAEAIAVTVAVQIVKKKEQKATLSLEKRGAEASSLTSQNTQKIAWSRKLRWLSSMLWGGVLLLAFEHLWHGEIVPWFPFLTAASNPADTLQMLHELATVGVTMAVLVTVVWVGMVLVADVVCKRKTKIAANEA